MVLHPFCLSSLFSFIIFTSIFIHLFLYISPPSSILINLFFSSLLSVLFLNLFSYIYFLQVPFSANLHLNLPQSLSIYFYIFSPIPFILFFLFFSFHSSLSIYSFPYIASYPFISFFSFIFYIQIYNLNNVTLTFLDEIFA